MTRKRGERTVKSECVERWNMDMQRLSAMNGSTNTAAPLSTRSTQYIVQAEMGSTDTTSDMRAIEGRSQYRKVLGDSGRNHCDGSYLKASGSCHVD